MMRKRKVKYPKEENQKIPKTFGDENFIVKASNHPQAGTKSFKPIRALALGRSGMGKTTDIIRETLSIKKRHPKVKIILISPTYKTDESWKGAIKKYPRLITAAFTDPNDENTLEILNAIIHRDNKEDPFLVVVDDAQGSNLLKFGTNNPYYKIFTQPRQHNTGIILSAQKFTNIPLGVRPNVDLLLQKRLDAKNDLKGVHESFMGQMTEDKYKKLQGLAFQKKWDTLIVDRTDPFQNKYYRRHSDTEKAGKIKNTEIIIEEPKTELNL